MERGSKSPQPPPRARTVAERHHVEVGVGAVKTEESRELDRLAELGAEARRVAVGPVGVRPLVPEVLRHAVLQGRGDSGVTPHNAPRCMRPTAPTPWPISCGTQPALSSALPPPAAAPARLHASLRPTSRSAC